MTKQVQEYLATIDEVIAQGTYKDTWESLIHHPVPAWYRNAKFGIFIHWGVYSVPAFGNEWYSRWMYKEGTKEFEHHLKTYGSHNKFGYKDFIPMFRAEKFNPAEWAELFQKAGAQFVMPVAEHHDGFQMYQSDLSEWCAAKMGPQRDVLGELKHEIEQLGMTFTASSHRVEHYWFMHPHGDFAHDQTTCPQYGDLYWPSKQEPFPYEWNKNPYDQQGNHIRDGFEIDVNFMEDWLVRTCELVDKYQPKIIYFDWWIEITCMKPYVRKFMAYYYNMAKEWGAEVTINYKFDACMYTSAVRDVERGQLAEISPDFWQCDTSVAKNSWCYTEGNDYKEAKDIICDLIDICSKNGSLLLNIGPKSDGTIPEEDTKILEEIGQWLEVNGEAIYGTTYWKKHGEGPTKVQEGFFTDTLRKPYTHEDFRFTFKDGNLYVFAMQWPKSGKVTVQALGSQQSLCNALFKKVEILGYNGEVCITRTADCLTLQADGIVTDKPAVIKIEMG